MISERPEAASMAWRMAGILIWVLVLLECLLILCGILSILTIWVFLNMFHFNIISI